MLLWKPTKVKKDSPQRKRKWGKRKCGLNFLDDKVWRKIFRSSNRQPQDREGNIARGFFSSFSFLFLVFIFFIFLHFFSSLLSFFLLCFYQIWSPKRKIARAYMRLLSLVFFPWEELWYLVGAFCSYLMYSVLSLHKEAGYWLNILQLQSLHGFWLKRSKDVWKSRQETKIDGDSG